MPKLDWLNGLDPEEARQAFFKCCGAQRWADNMTALRPFRSLEQLLETADEVWWDLFPGDWKEAFCHHPKIGDRESLRKKFACTADWAEQEQAGARAANEETLAALEAGNRAYEEKFGYIFILCATGKSAPEMLALLQERLKNDPETEIQIAAEEQAKITKLRLEKL